MAAERWVKAKIGGGHVWVNMSGVQMMEGRLGGTTLHFFGDEYGLSVKDPPEHFLPPKQVT